MIQNLYYNSPEFKTLGDFLSQEGISPAFAYKENPRDFLFIVDLTGRTNFDKIIDSYFDDIKLIEEAQQQFSIGNFNSIKLSPPILFSIDSRVAKTDLYSTQGNLVQNVEDVGYFISKALAGLMTNPGYVLKSKNKSKGDLRTTYPKVTVWLWSRSLSTSFSADVGGLKSNYELINISPFIDSIGINSGSGGSGFNFSIAPIKGSYPNDLEGWKMKLSSFKSFGDKGNPQYKAQSSMETEDGKMESFFFHNVIQQNDLVFISFEDIPTQIQENRSQLSVSFSEVKGKIWDLIGFVDGNSLSYSKEGSNNVSIRITGRDLTKLIIEDGSYFWATEFGLDGTIRFAGNTDNRIVRRVNSGPEGLISYFAIANKSIEYAMKFVISQLANTGIVPTEIFNSYGQERSTIFIRKKTGERVTVLESVRTEKAFNSEFFVRVKKKEEIIEVVADGVWAITKVLVDPNIANLRLVDASIFTEQGSLINYLQTACQSPFVEFYTDTIADKFYWIARKPPYGLKSILGAINGIYNSDSNELVKTEFGYELPELTVSPSFVIDIDALDTISVDVQFDERVYTWFKLESRYALGGGGDSLTSLALLPAVFLPTYTNIFGSRPLNVSTSYVNYIPASGKEDVENYRNAIEQSYYDLKWLIETHSYLPFTRTGSIRLNEDRRIKKGMFVRLHLTNEIYLVTDVNHTISISNNIQRETIIQVERGMVEKYIEGQEIDQVGLVSYFNIVDMPINLRRLRERQQPIILKGDERPKGDTRINDKNSDSILTNWRENEQVINFFLNRRQFKP